MRYIKYGIVMERLQKKHLEQLRQWRNQDFIRAAMQFRGSISPEDQLAWYKNIDPHTNWYFIAYFQKKPMGLFHIKDINWTENCGESGGFVANQKSMGSVNIGLAILALMDFAFLFLQLDSLVATYHSELKKIVRLNEQLGYESFATTKLGFTKARITKERFYDHAHSFRKAAEHFRGNDMEVENLSTFLKKKLKSHPSAKPFQDY